MRGAGFWLINVTNFLDGMCYFGYLNLLTLFLGDQLHMGDKPTGWMVSVYTGLVTLFMIQGGNLCDRLGARATLRRALGWLLLGRGLLIASALVGWPLALVALLVMAYGTGLVQPSVYAGVKETTRPEELAMGYAVLYAMMNVGVVTWSLLSPIIRDHYGIQGTYQVLWGVTLLNLASQFTLALQKREVEVHAKESRMVDGPFLAFIFLLVPVRMLMAHLWLTLPTVIKRAYQPEVIKHLEWCGGFNALVLAIGTPILTRLTRRQSIMPLMIGGTLVSALAPYLLVMPGPGPLVAYLLFFSLGEAVWASRFYEYVARVALPGRLGASMGVANLPWFLAKTTAGLYSGAMLEHFVPASGAVHPGQLWSIYATFALVTPLGLLMLSRRIPKGSPTG